MSILSVKREDEATSTCRLQTSSSNGTLRKGRRRGGGGKAQVQNRCIHNARKGRQRGDERCLHAHDHASFKRKSKPNHVQLTMFSHLTQPMVILRVRSDS